MENRTPEEPAERWTDGPPEPEDPRLEIPEVLRRPVEHPSKHPKPPGGMETGLGDLGKALAIGLDFLFTAAAGGVVGYLFDRWLGSSPTGLLVGLGIGFAGGTVRLIQRSTAEDRKRAGDGPRGPGRSR